MARKQENKRIDRAAMARSERAAAYFNPRAPTPAASLPGPAGDARELRNRRHCYVCKQPFRRLHAFYHALCVSCGERNYAARSDSADLTGRRAIVTGGRIKIGFEIAMSLWRAGAHVTVTTRFPRDAERRFAEAGVTDRLTVVGLDFLDLAGVLRWIGEELERGEPLDILINNAAQTVRRPAAYYARLAAAEARANRELAAGQARAHDETRAAAGDDGWVHDAPASAIRAARKAIELAGVALAAGGAIDAANAALAASHALDEPMPVRTAPTRAADASLDDADEAVVFPDQVDAEGKPVDLRDRNSWVAGASEVDPAELAEVHVVNAIVPFLIASRLRPLMQQSRFVDRYIVNVSAMEGVFAYGNKQHRHPHTNMAKAALNMFTRTSAAELARDGIYMNSVDTGWITQENPYPLEQRLKARGFCPPLDIVDGAARVLAPVYRGVRGDRVAGTFFKDYEPAPW